MALRFAMVALAAASVFGQTPGPTSTGSSSTGAGSNGGGTSTGTGTSRGTVSIPNQAPGNNQPQFPENNQPIFVSGRVLLDDGTPAGSNVVLERVCSTRTFREGYADSKGQFSFQLGGTIGVFADASTDTFPGPGMNSPGGFGGGFDSFSGNSNQVTTASLFGCELRASLPGYHSDSVPLANRRPMDTNDLGVIVLHYMGNVQGMTTSATTALAPKEAKKAFERGTKALQKKKIDEAQKELLKAVELHPRFAEAWYRLGLVYEQREHRDEAREAYAKAIAADGNLTPPYERLYLMAFNEQKWDEVAERTDRVLRLNPYDNQAAYYFNAVANFQLHKLDAAEKSARESAKLTGRYAQPRAHYVLGLVLAQKGNFSASVEELRSFLKIAPPDIDRAKLEKLIGDVDLAAQQKAAAQ